MTLIVTLRTPDGVVIAGDSLSTMIANKQVEGDFAIACPACHQKHTIKGKMPNICQSNTMSHAQKVFPFLNTFGVGTFGLGQVAGKTIYFAIRELEATLSKKKSKLKSIADVANAIGKHFHHLIQEQVKLETQNSKTTLQKNYYPLGFQIVSYAKQTPITCEMHIGNDISTAYHSQLGITYTGRVEVINTLFARFKTVPQEMPVFQYFSLQDALTYAEFLISTTATYQHFSNSIASVGGAIDVALVTPFDGFRWIKQKSLQARLTENTHTAAACRLNQINANE